MLAVLMSIFLSTPSARRATVWYRSNTKQEVISIHALCEEGDPGFQRCAHYPGISIHALCEEGDLLVAVNVVLGSLFLSTPSARRATFFGADY